VSDGVLILPIYVLVLIVGTWLYRKAAGSLFRPSIPMLFFWFYIFFDYLGTAVIFHSFDYFGVGQPDVSLLWKIWINVSLCFILVPLVIIIMNSLFGANYASDADDADIKGYNKVVFYSIAALSIIPIVLYIRKLSQVPLFLIIVDGTNAAISEARSDSTNAFDGKYHWYFLFFGNVIPFLSYAAIFNYFKKRESLLIVLALVCLSIFGSLLTLQKAPIVFYLVSLIYAYYYYYGKRISNRMIAILGGGIFAVFMAVFTVVRYSIIDRPTDALRMIAARVFGGQIVPLHFYYQMFPKYEDFLFGRSLPNPGGILPHKPYSVTLHVMEFMKPYVSADIVGSAPTVFFGEVYANFGDVGVIASMLLMGMVLYIVQKITVRLRGNVLGMAFGVWFAMEVCSLTMSGVGKMVFNFYVICIALLAMLIYVSTEIIKGASENSHV
jgi:oligosaccharide repeat unit polymerase